MEKQSKIRGVMVNFYGSTWLGDGSQYLVKQQCSYFCEGNVTNT